MATTQNVNTITVPANADLSTHQFKFGVLTNSSGVARVAVAGAGTRVEGVIMGNPSVAGDACEFAIGGCPKVVAGAAITAGAHLASDATGRAVTGATGNQLVAVALKSAAAAGDIIPVLLKYNGIAP